jgi:hypothetical protein
LSGSVASNTVAPAFKVPALFGVLSCGSALHRSRVACSVLSMRTIGCRKPASVGRNAADANGLGALPRVSVTGRTSATGVPAQPPSENEFGPPSISNPPPRLLTKSAII